MKVIPCRISENKALTGTGINGQTQPEQTLPLAMLVSDKKTGRIRNYSHYLRQDYAISESNSNSWTFLLR